MKRMHAQKIFIGESDFCRRVRMIFSLETRDFSLGNGKPEKCFPSEK
jgi:hypothetical protein